MGAKWDHHIYHSRTSPWVRRCNGRFMYVARATKVPGEKLPAESQAHEDIGRTAAAG
jgi:hypothetical protein